MADYRVENATYIVKDGQITQVAAPKSGYGEQRIIYKDGKPFDIIKVERTRITGHDVI
nr:DUF3954 domain-containing protein [Heyndrickxia ginsengihumi]